MTADQQAAEVEGQRAAERGLGFDICPYTFAASQPMEQREFDAAVRPLLNAWFSGWRQRLEQLDKKA